MDVLVTPGRGPQDCAPHNKPACSASTILARLRGETRREHEAVEHVLDLMGALSHSTYCQRLVQFYGFYNPLEAALKTRCTPQHGDPDAAQLALHLPRLHKSVLLRQDLQCLGVSTAGLAQCRALPPLHTTAEVLGCLYVLEGATLGGRLITQHVQATLGITPTTGGRFFDGYAADTAKMWHAMRQTLLLGAVDAQAENTMVASAIATFASLRGWCELTRITNPHERRLP